MLGANPRRRVWVAQVGGRVVGMCAAQVIISTAEGGEAAIVEDVVVDRMLRRRGIGQELLAAVDRWARQRGIRRLQLLADHQNFAALNFYSRRGWLPTRMVCLRHWVRRD
jgi:GNAT superfamily N-acetyltransferase